MNLFCYEHFLFYEPLHYSHFQLGRIKKESDVMVNISTPRFRVMCTMTENLSLSTAYINVNYARWNKCLLSEITMPTEISFFSKTPINVYSQNDTLRYVLGVFKMYWGWSCIYQGRNKEWMKHWFSSKYEVCSESIETETVFTKTEINNEWDINFLRCDQNVSRMKLYLQREKATMKC